MEKKNVDVGMHATCHLSLHVAWHISKPLDLMFKSTYLMDNDQNKRKYKC